MKDMFNKRQRFSLRKYSFGVASVLLGMTLFSTAQIAQADEVSAAETTVATASTGDSGTSSEAAPATATPAAVTTATTPANTETVASTPVASSVASTAASTAATSSEAATSEAPASETASTDSTTAATPSQPTVGRPVTPSATPATASMPRRAGYVGTTGTAMMAAEDRAVVVTSDPKNANESVPTGKITDITKPAVELSNYPETSTIVPGNSVIAATLPSNLARFAVDDPRKRVALITEVTGKDGLTPERYYVAVNNVETKEYVVDEYDSSFNKLNSKSSTVVGDQDFAPFGTGSDKPKVILRTASTGEVSFVFERPVNWKDQNKYSPKRLYTAVMTPVIPDHYGFYPAGVPRAGEINDLDKDLNKQSYIQNLPFATYVKVNYLEEGTDMQLAPSNKFIAFIDDAYTTAPVTEDAFLADAKGKGYELVASPVYKDGKVKATYWGGKGFVALNEVTNTLTRKDNNTGVTHTFTRDFVVRRTVVNENGDLVIEMWDKATGKKLPVKSYSKTTGGSEGVNYDTVFVSAPIRPSDKSLPSDSIYDGVDFIWKDEEGLMSYSNGGNYRYTQDETKNTIAGSGGVLISNWTNSWQPSAGEFNYYYARPKGDVTVEYYIEGTPTKIAADQKAANQEFVKEAYDASTAALRPAEITYNGDTYRLVETNGQPVLKAGSAAMTGIVEKTPQTVQYQYALVVKQGNVDVTYKAEDGTVLEGPTAVVTNQEEGTAYTTSQKTFPGYTFKGLETGSAAASGNVVADQTLHVVYVYSPVAVQQNADITIVAVDANGNAMTVARKSGTTTTAIVDGVLETSANLQGQSGDKVEDKASAAGFDYQALIAKYQKLGYQVVAGSYTGTGSLASKGTMTAYDGTQTFDNDASLDQHFVIKLTPIIVPFDPTTPVNPGQTVPGLPNDPTYPTPDNAAAADSNQLKEAVVRTVTYFTEDKDGNNKTAIAQSDIATKSDTLYFRRTGTVNLVTGEVVLNGWTVTDSNYTANNAATTADFVSYASPVHTGYILKAESYRHAGAHTGVQATDADYNDQVIYVPIANYVPQWPTGDTPNTPWTRVPYTNDPTDPAKIVTPTDPSQGHIPYVPGYTPQDPSGNPLIPVDPTDPSKGYYPPTPTSATDNTVIPYTRNGNVVVKYVDDKGNTLRADRTDVSDAPVGTNYDTNEAGENPTRLTTTDGKVYELVSVDGNEKGQVVSGTTTVTYIYTDVTPKRGNVIVKYVSDTGITLKADRTDTSDAVVGTPYNTNEAGENPTIITTADGSTYGKIRVQGNETGRVVEVTTTVTYVYTLLKSPKGDVVVGYIDEDGKTLKESRLDTPESPIGTPYNTNENGENPQYIDATDSIRYEKVGHKGNETGKVVEGTTTVDYIYRAMGMVVVDYVDENGNKLINSRIGKAWASQGSDYDVSEGNPRVIYRNGVRYEVERVVGQEKGKVGKGRTTVTYVYRRVDEPTTPTNPTTPGQPANPTSTTPDGKRDANSQTSKTVQVGPDGQPIVTEDGQEALPETGDSSDASAALGATILGSLVAGLAFSRKKKED